MSRKASYPSSVTIQHRVQGPAQHLIKCACATCQEELAFTIQTRKKPPELLHKLALRRTWTEHKGRYYCPNHSHTPH